jgi:hypothetical protein
MGGAGLMWIEPLSNCLKGKYFMLEVGVRNEFYHESHPALQIKPMEWFFRGGMATSKISQSVNFRVHRYASVFSDAGQSALLPIPVQRLTFGANELLK